MSRASGARTASNASIDSEKPFSVKARPLKEANMAENILVSCIKKRGAHLNPHERIEGLGGMHADKRWYLPEDEIITELEKPDSTRQWNFYTSVNGKSAWVIVASHGGRKYLKTTADGYEPNNLLSLPECP
jgi:hypothetical protein